MLSAAKFPLHSKKVFFTVKKQSILYILTLLLMINRTIIKSFTFQMKSYQNVLKLEYPFLVFHLEK